MKNILCLVAALAAGSIPTAAFAGIAAEATISSVQDGSNFDYTIHLTNVGTESIQTFWYAWIPGQDYLATSPFSIVAPTNWVDLVTHAGSSDGFAIQFKTTNVADALQVGSSLDFKFSSVDTPAEVAGDSNFFPGVPVGTSFVYQGVPFSGDSFRFTVQSVPEPSSIITLGLGGLSLIGYGIRRRQHVV